MAATRTLARQPGLCIVKASGTPSAVSLATLGAAVPWDTDVFDPLAWHDPSTKNTRITPTANGYYTITGNFQFVTNATGRRASAIRLDGSTLYYGRWLSGRRPEPSERRPSSTCR